MSLFSWAKRVLTGGLGSGILWDFPDDFSLSFNLLMRLWIIVPKRTPPFHRLISFVYINSTGLFRSECRAPIPYWPLQHAHMCFHFKFIVSKAQALEKLDAGTLTVGGIALPLVNQLSGFIGSVGFTPDDIFSRQVQFFPHMTFVQTF